MEILDLILDQGNLEDACRPLGCDDERLDRVLFRSSENLHLIPTQWFIPPEFVDADGNDLSDHKPVAVRFEWAVVR